MRKRLQYGISIVLFLTFSVILSAQNSYSIDDKENVLTKKEQQSLEKMIDYELTFFNKIFPSAKMTSLDVKVTIFQKYSAYLLYKKQIEGDIKYYKSLGFYSSGTKEVIVCKEKNNSFMETCYHELSHFFLHLSIASPPAWMDEGLATYFGNCRVSSKDVKHQRAEYLIGRLKTMIEMKDIDLRDFVTWKASKFAQISFTQDNYGYAAGYCMILYLLQKDENLTVNIMQAIMQNKSSEEAFDTFYTGGFSQFEKDFMAFYSN